MEQPDGFKIHGQERKVLKLKRAIYGLKQAARAWWIELDKSLHEFGFKRIYADAGIFICQHNDGTFAIMMAYVDDIIVTGPNKMLIYSRKKLFMEKWECHDLGQCSEFLRSRICYENGKIYLDQCPYVDKILERFGLANASTLKLLSLPAIGLSPLMVPVRHNVGRFINQ